MDFLEMCRDAIEISRRAKLPRYKFNKIIFSGMGGSGAGGEVAKDFLSEKISVPIEICKNFDLPRYADPKTLIFCVSYSGNTKETLSQFSQALKKGCKIISITSDGKLKRKCEKLKIPFIEIPKGLLPREAFPYLFFPPLIYFQKLKLINLEKELKNLSVLEKVEKSEIKRLAKKLKDAIVFIYAPNHLKGIARRIKNQLNENSKLIAKLEILPELMHNEVESLYEKREDIKVIFVRDSGRGKINNYFEILKELMKDKFEIFEIYSKGKNLSGILYLIYFFDLLSIEIAKEKGIDYRETRNIDFIKSRI